jgi:hypothetical protein
MITQGPSAAKEPVPVMALSQLSRQVENREDKKPQPDLRSPAPPSRTPTVMLVYRESYYLFRLEPREGTSNTSPGRRKWRSAARRNQYRQAASRSDRREAVVQ